MTDVGVFLCCTCRAFQMLRLHLLGSLDLFTTDGQAHEAALRQLKPMAVLAYLAAARPRGFHRRDSLAALFWPDLNDERARAALRTTLSRLRDDLGDGVIRTRGADEVSVDPRALWCDVVALDDALAADDVAGAMRLYRGPFLDGVHVDGAAERLESWMAAERDAIRLAVLDSLGRATERAQSGGRYAEAIGWATHAVGVAPTDEQAARRLIALHVAAGDRGSAAAAYARLATNLRREFDVAPSPETRMALGDPSPSPESLAAPAAARGLHVRVATAPTSPVPEAPRVPPGVHGTGPAAAVERRKRGGLVLVTALLAVLGAAALTTLYERGTPAASWRLARVHDGTVLSLSLPSAVLDSSESALLIVFGAQAFHPLRLNAHTLRVTGLGAVGVGWQRLPDGHPRPPPRWGAATAYDPASDRLFVAGGALGTTSPCTNDVWWSAPASGLAAAPEWHRVRIDGDAPPPRAHAQLGFDRHQRRLILFGGNDCFTKYFHDAWLLEFTDSLLSRGRWRPVPIDSTAGAPRALPDAAAVVELEHDRVIVVDAGLADLGTSTVWELAGLRESRGARWRRLSCTPSLPPRQNAAMAVEQPGGSLLLFGGLDVSGREYGDLWRLQFGEGEGCRWRRIETAGEAPFPRTSPTLFVSQRRGRLILFGGKSQQAALHDLWELPLDFSP